MVQFAEFSDEEKTIVWAIATRSVTSGIHNDHTDALMDISATHVHCPLRLADLLNANEFNFAHDLVGIYNHLDRKTGKLKRAFLPRYAKGEA